MPTYEQTPRFVRDLQKLDSAQRKRFRAVLVEQFIPGLSAGKFPESLRVKRVQATREKVWEMTWAPDGRATFQYGPERRPGQPHVIWRRVGSHDIFRRP